MCLFYTSRIDFNVRIADNVGDSKLICFLPNFDPTWTISEKYNFSNPRLNNLVCLSINLRNIL